MKKFLPIFIFAFLIGLFLFKTPVFADTPTQQMQTGPQAPDGSWVIDPEVTFIGKNAARSGNLLDFTLQNYNWVCVKQIAAGQCDNSNNPLSAVWLTSVTYIVVPLLFLVVLVTAIIIIVTRGRSLTIMRFLPRFIAVILLIFFSFALLQFLYQFTDVTQGFFLRNPDYVASKPINLDQDDANFNAPYINQRNLLFVGWKYQTFQGLRLVGDANTESAFISLLLTKLTALTYFVMVGILYIRRIILWLFIIVSPIFPLLLLYYPVRNTGKIWIGEFFRWLLYAPLFAIFLKGLVSLWRSGIPLVFEITSRTDTSKIVYPTAVNILLGGPHEFVTKNNSVNLTETFALYVVSLLMLWGVIILPWILLQIFLDYAQNLGVGDSAVMKNMVNMINRQNPPSPSPHSPANGGSALNLPFTKKFNMPIPPPSAPTGTAREIPITTTHANVTANMPSAQVKAQVLTLTNMSLPSMRDIAKFDTSLISRDSTASKEAITIRDNLVKIGNPQSATSVSEKEKYTEIRERLVQESNTGNTLATSILTAANTASKRESKATTSQIKSMLTQIANPQAASGAGSSSVINHEKLSKMNESLVKSKKEGNTLAASILAVTDKTSSIEIEKLQEKIMDAKAKGEPVATQIANAIQKKDLLPAANRVQTVSKEDYQAVKDMWKENYQNLEVPEGMAGTRTEWVKDDIAKIDNIIALLDSKDEERISQGMQEVSSILPFLLVGGFSQAEIVAYLKAKQEAAKEVVVSLEQEEEDKVSINVKKTATATQTMTASISDNSDEDDSDLSNISTAKTNVSSKTGASIGNAADEILKLTNLELPRLTDIVKYEVRSLSKDKTESERIEKMHDVLEKIGNPTSITTPEERAQYETLRERLGQESMGGNITANVILSAVSQLNGTVDAVNATLSDIKIMLRQIANPQNIQQADDRDYYTRLHEYLETESKQKNNVLAQQILSVNETTKEADIQTIKDQLVNTQKDGNLVLPEISTAVSDFVNVSRLKRIINQIISPEAQIAPKDQIYRTINETLKTENIKGSSLAKSLMSINNSTSDTTLRQVNKELKESSKKGDILAASITSIVSSTSDFAAVPQETVKTALKQIANPAIVSNDEERSYYAKIHDSIETESRSANNKLAEKLLTINDSTSTADIQKVKEGLLDASNPISSQVTSFVSEIAELRKLKEVIVQSVSPSQQVAPGEQEKIAKLRKVVNDSNAKGSKIAATLLAAGATPSDSAIRQIQEKLTEAEKNGDPTAKAILSEVSGQAELSSTNRLQEVKPEEYEEAKELWKKAYLQYLVPAEFTEDIKGRLEWINSDIKDITETIELLNSNDEEKKNMGIKKVSSILPFLLLGGFSYPEMIKYLQTKVEAAREALKIIEEDEEKSVELDATKAEKPAEMQAKVPDENDKDKN